MGSDGGVVASLFQQAKSNGGGGEEDEVLTELKKKQAELKTVVRKRAVGEGEGLAVPVVR